MKDFSTSVINFLSELIKLIKRLLEAFQKFVLDSFYATTTIVDNSTLIPFT